MTFSDSFSAYSAVSLRPKKVLPQRHRGRRGLFVSSASSACSAVSLLAYSAVGLLPIPFRLHVKQPGVAAVLGHQLGVGA
jgi:hypothetical protein